MGARYYPYGYLPNEGSLFLSHQKKCYLLRSYLLGSYLLKSYLPKVLNLLIFDLEKSSL